MDTQDKLQQLGFTGQESRVYLELVKNPGTGAQQIARNLSIERTLAYSILNKIVDKGQATYIVKDGRKRFSAAAPENLYHLIKPKETLIGQLIKDLQTYKSSSQEQTTVEIYEGKDGLRTLIRLALKEKTFCSFGSTGRTFFALHEMPAIAKQVQKSTLGVRIIGSPHLRNTTPFKFKKMQFRYLDIPSEATTSIFGDYVSIHIINEKPILILIKNKLIAASYQAHFDVLWKQAKI